MDIFDVGSIGKTIGKCINSKYFLLGVGSVGAAFLLGQVMRNYRPFVVGATKEAISFKDWLGTNLAEGEEFWQDVTAEAKHLYKLDVEKKLEILQKQQEVLQKIKTNL